jgi:hypothetical protein
MYELRDFHPLGPKYFPSITEENHDPVSAWNVCMGFPTSKITGIEITEIDYGTVTAKFFFTKNAFKDHRESVTRTYQSVQKAVEEITLMAECWAK